MRQNIKTSSNRFTAPQVKIGNRSIIIYGEDERFDIAIPDGIPDDMELPEAGTVLKNVAVNLNGAGDKLYGMYPAAGTHIVSFERFSSKENAAPTPRVMQGGERKTSDGRKWYAPDKLVFTALLRVLRGDFAGMIIPWTIDYIFEKDTDGSAMLNGGKRSIERVTRFLELCGFDTANDTIRWTDNVLPDLEMLLSTDSYFQVTMKNGWIDEAAELPAGLSLDRQPKGKQTDEDWDEEEPEEKPAKATASRRAPREDDPFEDESEDLVPDKKVTRPAPERGRRTRSDVF